MGQKLWLALAQNAAILLALFVIYEVYYLFSNKNKALRQIISGLLISAICIIIMSTPFWLMPGIMFDTRTILISVTAMLLGLVPTLITAVVSTVFRILVGGDGVYMGVAIIWVGAVIGLIWRRWLYPQQKKLRLLNIYAMSVTVHACMLICSFLLPYPQSIETLKQISLPVMFLFPITSVLLSGLLLRQQDRKFFEEKLLQSEEKYRNITENISDVVWVSDLNLHTTFVSPSVKKLLGEAPEQHMKKSIEERLPPSSIKIVKEMLAEELEKEKQADTDKFRSRVIELEHYKSDGSLVWVSMHLSFVRDNSGKAVALQGVSRDITKRKTAEAALKQSEDKYYNYIENAPDGIVVTDNLGNFLEVNKAACKHIGYKKRELIKMAIADLLCENQEEVLNQFLDMMKSYGSAHKVLSVKRKNGEIKWVAIDSVKIDDSRYLNFINDISVRIKAETELKQERDKAQMYLELANVIFIAFDCDMKVTLINRQGCKILGKSKDEILGKNWIENFILEEDRPSLKKWAEDIFNGKEDNLQLRKNPVIGEFGNRRIISWRNAILKDDAGNIYGILSSGVDITEQETTLKALLESERSKSVLISHIPGIAYRCAYDREWTMEFISDGCYDLTGYKPEDIIDNKILSFNDLVSKDYRQTLWHDWEKAVEEKTPFRGEYEILTASGDTKWVLEIGQAIYGKNNEVEALEGIIIDIDESHKRYEQIQYMNDHDFLTDLYNRRYFEEKKVQMDRPENLPISIITADINGLRLINDAFGHMYGDRLIKRTGRIIKQCCPQKAVLGRTGGDEFSILMPNTSQQEATEFVKCVKEACADFNSKNTEDAKITNISLGWGIKESPDTDINEVEKEAEDYMYRRKLLDRESHHSAIIASVMATMYARSQETEEHSERIAKLSVMIGRALRMPQKSLDELRLLAMLHDIGKVGIDDRILNKKGPLTDEEWEEMKKHPEIGFRIAMSASELEPIAQYILHHHERWDGTGYPSGLAGEDIPLLSRILAVADAYDAMTNDRIYKKSMAKKDAIEDIKNNAGKQFDADIANLFVELITKKEISEDS